MIHCFSESKWASSKSYLYGKSLRNAPRAAKIHFFLRYNHHDPLWWIGSLSPVLQIVRSSPLPPALCALAQLFPPQLPSSRSIFGSCLCHRGRHWTHREYPQSLTHNGLLPPLLGLPDFPHRDTLRTFLWRFDKRSLRSLQSAHDKLRTELFQRLNLLYSAIVDADTTTLITYGSQEGVAVGYIPKRRHGQPSYAPIISSEGRRGLSLGMDLRAGNVHASKEAWAFLQSILNKLPSSIASSRTRVRLDGAFYNKEIIEPLDQERLGYVVVAKMTRPLRKKMVAARYEPFARGWEAAEFTYTPFHWNENTGSLRYEGPWLWRPTKFSSVCSPSGATRTTGCW